MSIDVVDKAGDNWPSTSGIGDQFRKHTSP